MTGRATVSSGLAWRSADTTRPLDRRAVGTVLRDRAALTPSAVALFWSGDGGRLEQMTYPALYAAAARLATALRAEFEPQSRIAIWSPNAPEWLVLEYAVALAGMVVTPLNPALADGELAVLLDQSGAQAIYAARAYRGHDLVQRAGAVTVGRPIAVRSMDEVWVDAEPAVLPEVDVDSPFLLQYTSGTTGRPKGVVLSHLAAVNSAAISNDSMGLRETDTRLVALPLHHVGGSVCTAFPMVLCGGAVALEAGWDVDRAVALVAATGCTVLGGVPTMLLDVLDHPAARDGRLASVRILSIGGSSVAPSLIRRLEATLGATVVIGYGQSEAPVTVASRPDDSAEDRATTIGVPLPHREMRIADPATGAALPYDQVGELQIRSPLSMTGYWRDPEATAATIDPDGWLRSGDLCSMDHRGMITFQGRLRDVIIRGGENIYPAEIEDVLLRHPSVADVAVVGAPSERWGEEPVAFVRPAAGAVVDTGELDAWVRAHLAGFKRPRAWYVVDELPLTASGKVQKFVLRERLRG